MVFPRLARTLPLFFALAACGGSDDESDATSPSPPGPYAPPPASDVVQTTPVRIRREVFLVPGTKAPPNPSVGDGATPGDLENVRVVRYRLDTDPPTPARAIAVMMPGFLGGAGSFDGLARALVARGTPTQAIEAWAIDRRSNLLEDHHGADVAEVRRDPELAHGYYLDGAEVEGKTFAGFKEQSELPFVSEWGLPVTVGDLRAVIGLVPQAERRARVVLVGHSLGASIAEAYAAWDFDGTPGYAELAGLVLVDGVGGDEGAKAPARTQQQYEKGGDPAPGGFGTAPGVEAIRKSARYFTLPILGAKVYPTAAVVAMRALWSPTAVVTDPDRDKLLQTLLALSTVPRLQNRAALGLAFDASSNGLSFAAISCGEAVGPMGTYDSLFGGKLSHPTDDAATYGWTEFDQTNPPEATSLDDFARTWFSGPSLDFAEWYFPQRLTVDASVATTLVLAKDDWPVATYGIRAMHGKELDLPILAVPAGLVKEASAYDALRALVAAQPIGAGRPLAGTPRTSPDAFRVAPQPTLTHIDPLVGADRGAAKVFYDDVAGFLVKNAPDGGIAIPIQR